MSEPATAAPVPIGGEIILMGRRFEVAGHTTDIRGRIVEIPGKYLGPALKIKTAARSAVPLSAPAAAAASADPVAQSTAASRKRKLRATPAQRWQQRQASRQKPPPLQIVYEPWPLGNWIALIVVLGLVVAGIALSSAGSEGRKWEQIEGAARAVQPR